MSLRNATVRLATGYLALATAILWSGPASADDEPFCAGLESKVGVRTPHKKCIADHFPDVVDFYMNFPSCTVFVSMTQIDDPEELERKMRSGFTHFANILPSPPCPADDSPNFVFQQVDGYPFLQLFAWAEEAEPLVMYIEPDTYANVLVLGGELSVHLQTEAAAAKVVEILDELGIPEDARSVTSREAELLNMPSLAPIVSSGPKDDRILLPTYFWAGEKAADLELGRTTLREVERLMPAWPGHGPSKAASSPKSERSPWIDDALNAAIDKVRYNFNPAQTMSVLGFDRKKRLVMLQHQVQEGQGETLVDGLSAIAALEDIYRDDSTLIQRAQIGNCITADVGSSWRGDDPPAVGMVIFVYTCDPGKTR